VGEESLAQRKYRSDVEIFFEILRWVAASGERGIKKTHLMYRTNLNSKMLAKYLEVLVRAGAVEELEYRKEKIIRLGPSGGLAYLSLLNIHRVFYGARRTEEEAFVMEQLEKLREDGWSVDRDFIVVGRLEVPMMVDAFLSKGDYKYLVQVAVNRTEVEAKLALLSLYLALADTAASGVFITDLTETVEEALSPSFRDRLKVVSAKPLESVSERLRSSLLPAQAS